MNLQTPLSVCLPLSPAYAHTIDQSEGMWHTEASLPGGQQGGQWNGGKREYPTLRVYQKAKRFQLKVRYSVVALGPRQTFHNSQMKVITVREFGTSLPTCLNVRAGPNLCSEKNFNSTSGYSIQTHRQTIYSHLVPTKQLQGAGVKTTKVRMSRVQQIQNPAFHGE